MEIFQWLLLRGLLEALTLQEKTVICHSRGEGGCNPFNDLYREGVPKRGTFFQASVYEKVGISLVEVYGKIGNPVI